MQSCENEGWQQWREKREPADCDESLKDGCSAACLSRYDTNHSAEQHRTWRNVDEIGAHLMNSIAIAVQRCCGMALRASMENERRFAMGAAAE